MTNGYFNMNTINLTTWDFFFFLRKNYTSLGDCLSVSYTPSVESGINPGIKLGQIKILITSREYSGCDESN